MSRDSACRLLPHDVAAAGPAPQSQRAGTGDRFALGMKSWFSGSGARCAKMHRPRTTSARWRYQGCRLGPTWRKQGQSQSNGTIAPEAKVNVETVYKLARLAPAGPQFFKRPRVRPQGN